MTGWLADAVSSLPAAAMKVVPVPVSTAPGVSQWMWPLLVLGALALLLVYVFRE